MLWERMWDFDKFELSNVAMVFRIYVYLCREGGGGSKYIRTVWMYNRIIFKFWYDQIRTFMNVSLMKSVRVTKELY